MPSARLLALIASLAVALVAVALGGCGEKEEPDLGAATATTETTATTGDAASQPAAAVAGYWSGKLTQKGLAPFRVAVRIDPSGTGQVAYTGINCGGAWALETVAESDPPQFRFRETIDQGAGGKCKGSGTVTVIPSGAALTYTFSGGGVTSRGTLNRSDATGIRPIFKRAGTPPPA